MTAVKGLLQLGRIDGTEMLKTESFFERRDWDNLGQVEKLKNCETGGPERIFCLLKILSQSGLQDFINGDLTKNQAARLLKIPAN